MAEPAPSRGISGGGFLQAAGLISLAFLLSRVVGYFRDVAIANAFGTSRTLDAYYIGFRLPNLLTEILITGAISSAVIPVLSGYLVRGERDALRRTAISVINLGFVILTLGSMLLALLAPLAMPLLAPGFSPADRALAIDLTRIMLLQPIFLGAGGLITGALQAHHRFTAPALAPIVYNLAILASALWLAPALGSDSRQRVYGLAIGVAAGGFLHFAAQLPSFFGLRLGWQPFFDWSSEGVRQVARLMLPISIGLAATQVNLSVDQLLASTLPHGRVSALAFATSLMQIPIGTVGAAVGIVAFPYFARLAASGDLALLRRAVSSLVRLLLFLMLPATVGLIVLRVPLVQVVYQRGAFTADSTAQTAFALLFLALGVSAHSAIPLMSRVFYSFHDTRTPLRIALLGMLLNLVLSITLVFPLQQGGLGLATSLTAAFSLTLLLRSMRRLLPAFPALSLLRATLRMAAAAVLMGVAVAALLQLSQGAVVGADLIARVLWLLALVVAGGLFYVAATWLLRLPELPIAWAAAHGRVELLPEGA